MRAPIATWLGRSGDDDALLHTRIGCTRYGCATNGCATLGCIDRATTDRPGLGSFRAPRGGGWRGVRCWCRSQTPKPLPLPGKIAIEIFLWDPVRDVLVMYQPDSVYGIVKMLADNIDDIKSLAVVTFA